MSGYAVEYTESAEREIIEVYSWISEVAPLAAQKWRDDLILKVESLSENPLRYPVAPESDKFLHEIRVILFRRRRSQFRIYYTIERKRVVILTVRHSSRQPLGEQDINS